MIKLFISMKIHRFFIIKSFLTEGSLVRWNGTNILGKQGHYEELNSSSTKYSLWMIKAKHESWIHIIHILVRYSFLFVYLYLSIFFLICIWSINWCKCSRTWLERSNFEQSENIKIYVHKLILSSHIESDSVFSPLKWKKSI